MLFFLKEQLSTKKVQRDGVLFFLFFLIIFTVVDYLNTTYPEMAREFSTTLVAVNILLNIIMAAGSAFLMVLSSVMLKIKAIEPKGTNLGVISVFFAMLTYGCTPCVIALFANFGITFSVIALPFGGLPYKFMTLGLIIIGIAWSLYDIDRGACKVKFN
ncbi:MAG TPA: hypothetical protein VFC75_00335 [Erysipelothrix sp.]|nr:hypothetical protein [Erysipelothrix sp.]